MIKKLVLALAAVSTLGTAASAGSVTLVNDGLYSIIYHSTKENGHGKESGRVHIGQAATFYNGVVFKIDCGGYGDTHAPLYTDKHNYYRFNGTCTIFDQARYNISNGGHPVLQDGNIPPHARNLQQSEYQ